MVFRPRNVLLDNYTPIGNELIDEVLPKLKTLAETKIILHIYRQTFGFTKDIDEKGNAIYRENYFVTVRDLSSILNLSQQSIITGLKRLVDEGYLEKTGTSKKVGYKLMLKQE